MAILSVDTGERYYYYEDSDGNDVSMSSRGFFNYPNQPTQAPSFAYENDSSVKYNNLKNTVFQFAYRYVFADGRRSCYSPFSDVATQSSGEDLFGETLDSVAVGNKIVITPSMPLFKHELSEIEIVFRQVLSSADTWSVWALAGRITQYDILETASPTFDFYNNVAISIVDQEEVFTDYSALPRLADAQVSLMNNRVAYASITEGFDTVNPEVTLEASFVEMATSYGGSGGEDYDVVDVEYVYTPGVLYYHHKAIKILEVPSNGSAIIININGDTLSYIVSDSPSLVQLKTDIIDLLSDAGYSAITDAQYLTTYSVNLGYSAVLVYNGYEDVEGGYNTYPLIGSLSSSVYESPTVAFSKISGFKTGAIHPFCIYYYDELMRRSEPVVHDDMKIYLPFITEQDITNAGYIYKYNINWEVNHRPPSWSKYWRFGYAGNTSIGSFWQYSISDVSANEYTGDTDIDITPLQTITDNDAESGWRRLPNCNITPYSFEKGDRIRFITPAASGTDIQSPFSTTEYVDEYYDYEIRDYDDENNLIHIDDISDEYGAFVIGAGSVVEIYRPRREDQSTLYYEIGTLFAVEEDANGLYHVGETVDQEFDEYGVSTPAEGVLRKGDIYHFLRQFSFDVTTDSDPYPVESYSASDFYNSAVWGQGKSAYSTNIGQKKLNNIRWSDPLIQDSRINGVSMFQYDNYVSVNKKHGEITGMREVGHTLKVLQQSNNVSIGVGRTQYEDATGQSYVVQSDKILGTQRVSTSGYGCVNPESILQVGGYLYWFDALRGCMIRDAGGGAFPISGRYATPEGVADYKMEKFFQNMAQAVRWDSLNVFTGWDDSRKLVYVYTNRHKWVDLDGNEYTTIGINDQEWIVENFRCTKYENGDSIDNITDDTEWINTTEGAYCSYDNDDDNIEDYGLLYNWYAVETGIAYLSNNQGRGTGWRVPTDADWTKLTTYIGGESLAGGYLKATGTDYWNTPNTSATDLYGFNARGHGTRRETDAVFTGLKAEGVFWSSTEHSSPQAYRRFMLYSSAAISGGHNHKNYGFAVRLVRDVPPDYRAYSDRCVVFHESSNRWVTNIDLHDILGLSTGSSSMLSFIDSKALVHNHISAVKGTFNGVTYSPYTWVYSSEANHVNKLFHAIAVHANVKPRIEDVYVYTEEVVGGLMRSKIFYKLIKKIEGVFKAEFLRHVGRTLAFSKAKLYNGDLLRGKTLKAKISYDATEDESDIQSGINIYKVDLECETSDT